MRTRRICATTSQTVEQQRETASFGMWLFLLTEIMFFGGLFTAYLIYRNWYYPAFVAGSHQLSIFLGHDQHRRADLLQLHHGHGRLRAENEEAQRVGRLVAGYALFLAASSSESRPIEYHEKWEKHHVPGLNFSVQDFTHPTDP